MISNGLYAGARGRRGDEPRRARRLRPARLSDRRHVDLVHPHAQGRVPRDARHRRRRRPRGVRGDLGHLRAAARPARRGPPGHRLRRGSRRRCRTMPRASSGPRDRAAGDGPVRAGARPDGGRPRSRLLRDRGHVRAEEGEVRHRDGRRERRCSRRSRAARDAGARRAICDSETCRWQIAAATSTPRRAPGPGPRRGVRGRRSGAAAPSASLRAADASGDHRCVR